MNEILFFWHGGTETFGITNYWHMYKEAVPPMGGSRGPAWQYLLKHKTLKYWASVVLFLHMCL